jgi:choline-sulfatase
MDLGPTLLDMAGAPPMPRVAGRSIWPHMCGDPAAPDYRETFSEHFGNRDMTPSRMIRHEGWKLYHYHDDRPPVLYNLDADPGEAHDLAPDPRFDGVVRALMARLYEDWDPAAILHESARLDQDLRLLTRWGQETQLIHEDQLSVPDVEDVTLV